MSGMRDALNSHTHDEDVRAGDRSDEATGPRG